MPAQKEENRIDDKHILTLHNFYPSGHCCHTKNCGTGENSFAEKKTRDKGSVLFQAYLDVTVVPSFEAGLFLFKRNQSHGYFYVVL